MRRLVPNPACLITIYKLAFIILLLSAIALRGAAPTDISIFDITETKITASDGAAQDQFGRVVAVSGNRVVAGSAGNDDNGSGSGSVYVYEYDGTNWIETLLLASDGAASDNFGVSVGISGDRIIVGADKDDDAGTNSGSAYIYNWNGSSWVETKLTAADGADNDNFGSSVSISGDTAIVGAKSDDDNGDASGSAYIYQYNGSSWVPTKLTASDGAVSDFFGASVSISTDTAIVGANGNDHQADDEGAAYIFKHNGSSWVETKLTASDAAIDDRFGNSVSISGDTAVVGANGDDDNGSSSGSIYIFTFNGSSWSQIKLQASDGAGSDNFGYSVSVSGNKVIVGSYGDDDNGSQSGSAYLFENSSGLWDESKLLANDGESNNLFGWGTAISGNIAVSGAYFDSDNGTFSGSAYIYNIIENNTIEESAAAGTLISKLTVVDSDSSIFTFTEISDTDNIFDIVGNEIRISNSANLNYDTKTTHSLTVEVEDESGSTYQETFVYNVIDTDNVKAVDDSYNTNEGSALVINAVGGVLQNDIDYGNTSLSVSILDQASNGNVTLNADGSFTYTPDNFFNGVDSFSYTAINTFNNTDSATVSINVSAINNNPSSILLSFPGDKLTSNNTGISDNFGSTVAISGNTTAIGAYQDDTLAVDGGALYVFQKNGSIWDEQFIAPSDSNDADLFGQSVDISGNRVIAGSPQDDDNGDASGSAYVFDYDGTNWNETKITASDGAADDSFGSNVAIAGDRIIVGAYSDDDNGNESGSAYIYDWNGSSWVETKLTASDGSADDNFGASVDIDGDTAIVGAYQDNTSGSFSGSAYIYQYNGTNWIETKLSASDGASQDLFGWDVAISGTTAVVSAIQDDDNGNSSGSVYVYEYNGSSWIETKLIAGDGTDTDFFGRSVAISGNKIIVGANGDDDKGNFSGSAYLYEYNGSSWVETKMLAIDGSLGDYYGWSSDIDGDSVIIGARLDDTVNLDAGAAYVYDVSNNGSITENTSGGTLISLLDAVDVDSNSFTFTEILDPDNIFDISGNQLLLSDNAVIDYESKTSHSISIEANDGAGGTLQLAFNFAVIDVNEGGLPGYSTWIESYIGQGAPNNGMLDDADGDGIENALEFYFSLDPSTSGDSANLPQVTSSSPSLLVIEYTRNDSIGDTPVSYESSADLINWASTVEGIDYSKSTVDNGNGTETLTLSFNLSGSRLFIRTAVDTN